ncbi:MAG TPA: DUF1080 domain-containing protein [Planctomycetaceae bacterium]|nr:DUF1080 domain-containing protein [Planctomycetaceae bacterium]
MAHTLRTLPLLAGTLACLVAPLAAQVTQKGVWIDPQDQSIPEVFLVQGEYVGQVDGGDQVGAQVIALDEEGAVQAVVYPGGLPGAGWDEKHKILLDGKLVDGHVELQPAAGDRKYMDGNPQRFSATKQFPPEGHTSWSGAISNGVFRGQTDRGTTFVMKHTVRKSPTLGAKPPENAVVLFDGTDLDRWNGGRLDEATQILHTDAKDVKSKDKFKSYTVHLEFRTPFRPKARSQRRGNSGFYQANGQEVQVLDSFGLEGVKNECGGLYGRADCRINMCLPPLVWQTYDVELVANEADPKSATLTVRHNGVIIHDKYKTKLGSRGFTLQGHGNLLQYRNIWLVEHDTEPEPQAAE